MTDSCSLEKLFTLNRLGIIPGPFEEPEAFIRRAEYCLGLKMHLAEELKASLAADASTDASVLELPNAFLASNYDVSFSWIPLFFSNYRLPFWHGGCAWIFQVSENQPVGALIQLRRALQSSPTYMGIYHRDELLTHELTHVGRMAFQESKFEEMLAYETSPSFLRRYFGPLVQSSTESVLFILTLLLIVVFDFFLISTNRPDAFAAAMGLKLIPLVMIAGALIRLQMRRRIFKECFDRLKQSTRSIENARPVIYRLSDQEIISFAKKSPEAIREYAFSQAEKELRWKLLANVYFEGPV